MLWEEEEEKEDDEAKEILAQLSAYIHVSHQSLSLSLSLVSLSLSVYLTSNNNESLRSFSWFPLCELPFSCFTCLTWLHRKLYALRGDFLQMWLPFEWCEIGISECEIVRSHVNQPRTNSFYPWNRFWQTTYAKIKVHTKLCFRTNTTPNKIHLLQIPKQLCVNSWHSIPYCWCIMRLSQLLVFFFLLIWHWMHCSDWSDTRSCWHAGFFFQH